MNRECFDDGHLREYLEESSSFDEAGRRALEAHLSGCPECRDRLESVRATASSVIASMSTLAPASEPDLQAALLRMRARLRQEPLAAAVPERPVSSPVTRQDKAARRTPLLRPGPFRALVAGGLVVALVLSFLTVPALRAAADNLLQSFRAKSVVYLPISQGRLQQLAQFETDPMAFFVGKPHVTGATAANTVASVQEASQMVGFPVQEPSVFPTEPQSKEIAVNGSLKAQAQVDVHAISRIVQMLGLYDVQIPDALGSAPISADVSPFTQMTYEGSGYGIRLVEGRSPQVTLPQGVDMAQLGRAGLRILGMQPEQADQLSQQIDWSSTLVVPFPTNMQDVLQVQVGDSQGLLISSGTRSEHVTAIYWQKGDRFYVLVGQGAKMTNDLALLAAQSVK